MINLACIGVRNVSFVTPEDHTILPIGSVGKKAEHRNCMSPSVQNVSRKQNGVQKKQSKHREHELV